VTLTTSLPPSLVPTLPGSSYVDPAVFERELDGIFGRQWNAVARAADLPRPGSFVTVQVARESVIVVRGRDETLRAFLNVCRHRGARLCAEPAGEVKRSIRCGYHAWTYGLDGALVAAPNLVSMPDVDRTEFGLRPVHLREWLGYVWLNLADDPVSFDDAVVAQCTERLGDPTAIDRYGTADLVVGRRIEYDVRANWKLLIENFVECYHCATIHPELTGVLPEFAKGFAVQYYVGHGAEFGERVEGFTVDGSGGFDRLPTIGDEQDRRYYAITVRPQVFINLVPDHVIFHRMTPIAPDRTLVTCDWLYTQDVIDSGADLGKSVELFHRVNLQDFAACESCQSAAGSRAYADGGVLVPSEHHIAAFHDWVRSELAGPPEER
jgi:Rieske 2Fe-2S family protein